MVNLGGKSDWEWGGSDYGTDYKYHLLLLL